MALCSRFVVICSRRACEPKVGATSPDVSMPTPRFSARGRSVSTASSAMSDRSTSCRLKDRWSVRLSSSSASVRSIARALTAWRRSMSVVGDALGSLRATSSRVCVIASGVRSSCDAFAANRCCSATWASSRASMASKLSASSRNSSLRPSSSIRYESDPFAALRVASVMRARGRSMRPARNHPPTRPITNRKNERPGCRRHERAHEVVATRHESLGRLDRTGGHVPQEEEPDGREQQDARQHQEPRVAQRELEADAPSGRPIHRSTPSAPAPCSLSMR